MNLTAPTALMICLILSGPSAAAQITWEDEVCKNTVTFDPKKIDEEALRNTINLLFSLSPNTILSFSFPQFTPEQAARADLPGLQTQCAEILRVGKNQKLLPLPGIEEYRLFSLADTQDTCEFESARIRGRKDPVALRDFKPAASACSGYIDAVEGIIDLDQTWRDTVEAHCQKYHQPAACKARHFNDAAKPNGIEWQRLFVFNFGWNNCATRFMRINALKARRTAMQETLQNRFTKQFKIVKRECDYGATD